MKAMILAAGLGTRLRPLTDTRPKALVEIAGRTLLEITLSRLRSFGVNEVIINVHYFADMVVDYLKSKNNFGTRIEISREDDLLLDTGGGLKKAAWFFLEPSQRTGVKKPDSFIPSGARNLGKASAQLKSNETPEDPRSADEPFVLHNVDVISNIDLSRMLQFHNENHALATLAVQARDSSRLLLFNDQLQLCGRRIAGNDILVSPSSNAVIPSLPAQAGAARNRGKALAQPTSDQTSPSPHHPLHPLAFSGIHVVSPRLLPMLIETGVFSIIDAYLRLASLGEKILAFRADPYYWRDLGRPSDLSQATLDLQQKILL